MFYFIIPTINGEITGTPVILRCLSNILDLKNDVFIPYECTIYLIDYFNGKVTEIDY